jgi:hypothetical protein
LKGAGEGGIVQERHFPSFVMRQKKYLKKDQCRKCT